MNERRLLPDRRLSWTRKLRLDDQSIYLTVGHFDDGTPGELFIVLSRAGSTLRCALDQWARMFSTALQYGAPLTELVDMHLWVQAEPCGDVVGHPDIVRARSVFDLVARVMGLEYLGRTDLGNENVLPLAQPAASVPEVADPVVRDATFEELEKVAEGYRQMAQKRSQAVAKGYEGQACQQCGHFTLKRTGTCLTCQTCAATSGCT